jgi:hypothetical protein
MTAAALAHGGLLGAIAESTIAIAVASVFVAVWLRERSARKSRARESATELDD